MRPLLVLAPLCLAACAPIYVQPPAAGNAVVRMVDEGSVQQRSVQAYLNGKDCTDRMRTTRDEGLAIAKGQPFVLHAGREFAVSLEATRSVGMSAGTITREFCRSVASFTPEANGRYRVAIVASQQQCAVRIYQESTDPQGPERLAPSYRVRRWGEPLLGTACVPE